MTLVQQHLPVEKPLVQCRPSLSHYLRTWFPAQWNCSRFRHVRAFLLFVGYPRSGHTLIGSLLNAHRQMLVGHELNVMHYVKRRFTRNQLYWMLHQQDAAFSHVGRAWTTYDYQVPGQWQGRYERLEVIGDKHGNGATTLLGVRPDVLGRLRRTVGVPVKLLHVVRHPLDNIATMSRKYQIGVLEAARTYFSLCAINRRLLEDPQHEQLTVHLEDFIQQPRPELLRVLDYFDLPADVGYLNDCASIVFPEPRQSRHTIDWPADALRLIADETDNHPFLARYELGHSFTAITRVARRAA